MSLQIEGMNLRDYFASQALPACINWLQLHSKDEMISDGEPTHSHPPMPDNEEDTFLSDAAEAAYLYADAMIKIKQRI